MIHDLLIFFAVYGGVAAVLFFISGLYGHRITDKRAINSEPFNVMITIWPLVALVAAFLIVGAVTIAPIALPLWGANCAGNWIRSKLCPKKC